MYRRWRHSIRSDEGQVLVLFGLMAFVLVGFVALAVDVGFLLTERRDAQNIADAAALAGASAILAGESHSEAEAVAIEYANLNGATGSTTVTPVAEGDRWSGSVTVDIVQPVQKLFLGVLYTGPWQVGTHAVADITSVSDARYALVALDPPGIYVNGSMTVEVVNGGIMSNDVIESDGEANIVTADGYIDAAGELESASGWESEYGIRSHRAPIDDPFAGITPPPVPTEPDPPFTGNFTCEPDCTFEPGYYVDANILVKDVAHFEPGLYYFENSSIQLQNTSSRIEGEGVNFYFTGSDASFKPKNGQVNLTGSGWDPDNPTINGDWQDMTIWIDNCSRFESQGNQEFFIGGVLYAPCSEVYLHGNPNGDTISGMVVSSYLDIRGNSDFSVEYIPYSPTESFEVYLRE